MSIVQQVATLRRRAELPATRVARLAGTAASNIYAIERGRRDPSASTLERIAAAGGVRILAVPTQGAALVAETAEAVAARVRVADAMGAYRGLIQISDDLLAVSPAAAMMIAYPEPPGIDAGWDAAVAGIVEWRLTERATPLPEWLGWHGLGVEEYWEPFPAPYGIDADDVPEPLRRRNVWIERSELESA